MATSLIAMTLVLGVIGGALPGIVSGSMRLGLCGGYLVFSHIAITTQNALLLTAFIVVTIALGISVGATLSKFVLGGESA